MSLGFVRVVDMAVAMWQLLPQIEDDDSKQEGTSGNNKGKS